MDKQFVCLLGMLSQLSSLLSAGTPAFTYPGGLTKALILSFDDGVEQDRRLVELLNRYGLKGTFHLNSGFFGKEVSWLPARPKYVEVREVRELYAGHEVALHTHTHPDMTTVDVPTFREQIRKNREVLESLTGVTVTSFAWPFGRADEKSALRLETAGVTSGRLIDRKGDFGLPENWLLWKPTAHYSGASSLVEEFLKRKSPEPELLFLWGHSWEMDKGEPGYRWEDFEDLCRQLSRGTDLWITTMGEFQTLVMKKRGY